MYQYTKFDLKSENFDLYFDAQCAHLTEQQKEKLPKDMLRKFRLKYNFPFVAKLWMLWKLMNKRIWIIAEAEEGGLSVEEFVKLRESIKVRERGIPKEEGFAAQAHFVTGNKELCETMAYLNELGRSPAYNYIMRPRNYQKKGIAKWKDELKFVIRFLMFYESNRKTIHEKSGLCMAEWLTLIYCYYYENDVVASKIHKDVFCRTFQTSPNKIIMAYTTLHNKGMIIKTGNGRACRLSITHKGIDTVHSILQRYALNC